jgi:hypothetical protein
LVATSLSKRDLLGTLGARIGFTRSNYKITPGLYCTQGSNKKSPVLVTANYKLSFDALRKELSGIACWILVIDTRGINVWCAGGKGTFSTEEIAYQIQKARLERIVDHKRVIIPQLAANGVALHKLKALCGFRSEFGPIESSDLGEYLQSGATDSMRAITFTLKARAKLIPYEIFLLFKPLPVLAVLFFVISGISKDFFNYHDGLERGLVLLAGTLTGIFTGTVITPLALPWIPCRQFWLKGAVMGILGAFALLVIHPWRTSHLESFALLLWITACSSYMGMNFTGSTVFTSLSGVEKEMRKGLAFQITSATIALLLWVMSQFIS